MDAPDDVDSWKDFIKYVLLKEHEILQEEHTLHCPSKDCLVSYIIHYLRGSKDFGVSIQFIRPRVPGTTVLSLKLYHTKSNVFQNRHVIVSPWVESTQSCDVSVLEHDVNAQNAK